MQKICGIYKITNTITGDFYIGSSKNVKQRLAQHKCPSRWKQCKNNPMYQDMQKYGVDKFVFEVLEVVEVVEPEKLKEMEQRFIETLKPTYNSNRANGFDVERRKEYKKQYYNQLCCYNGETLTLHALRDRFRRKGIVHPQLEAKKYLLQ